MAPSQLTPGLGLDSTNDSIASTAATNVIRNPYSCNKSKPQQQQQQFVGGAEIARRNARKKKAATRILRPGEQRKNTEQGEELPKNMNIYERFFGALLRSNPSEFYKAATSDTSSKAVWHCICRRLGLAEFIPQKPIEACYNDIKVHFGVRAALVLEESREAISAALARRWKNQGRVSGGGSKNSSIPTLLHSVEGKSRHTGLAVIHFRKLSPLSREELFHVRPGSIFECVPRDNPNLGQVVLGVVSSSNRDEAENKQVISLIVLGNFVDTGREEWLVTPLCTLISELRQYEACSRSWNEANLPFLRAVMGGTPASHVRFDSDEEKENEVRIKKEDTSDEDDDDVQVVVQPGHVVEHAFTLPCLNKTQERAASSFLNSAPRCITIIQGPPGTGKTTLLISIICRYLLESTNTSRSSPRLLVCAPTNKAITVLATRFLQATNDLVAFNAVLVGDADKLLVDERSAKDSTSITTKLRSIFVYQWVPAILDEYLAIRKFVDGNQVNRNEISAAKEIYVKACVLHQRLGNSLPGLPQDMLGNARSISEALLQWTTYETAAFTNNIVKKIDKLISDFKVLTPETIYKELVASAHVLFCTLASAGGMIVKTTAPVHDLIVDEAAAATEPDLYIPFHLSPKRLLVVGDPLQLPATVLSRRAIQLGLSKSLHERLMYDCENEHIMLDVQYRMKPDISSFPSNRFYQGKVTNGDNVESPLYMGQLQVLAGRPFTFLQVNGVEKQVSSGSYQNQAEACAVVQLIKELREAANFNRAIRNSWHGSERLRVITFYQAQASLLKSMCYNAFGPHVVVATVDSSQGCEADIVIVSFVRSKSDVHPGRVNQAGFLSDDRRLNVALTRAKYQLICVGNARGMADMTGEAGLTLKSLAKYAHEHDCVRTLNENGTRQASLDELVSHNKRQRTS